MIPSSAVSEPSTLVGDIGGTHVRFAIAGRSDSAHFHLRDRVDLEQPFESFDEALTHYLHRLEVGRIPRSIVLAVAGPVIEGRVRMTNRKWDISESALHERGFATAHLINDFAALALAAAHLRPAELRAIGPQIAGTPDGPLTVVGAGTGFGVSCLVRGPRQAAILATEGGHIGFAPDNDTEIELLKVLARRFGRVSVERILSGSGLENLSRALLEIDGEAVRDLSAAQIVERDSRGDRHCHATLRTFCSILGAVTGDLALAHGARGGVLIAGGIAAKIESHLMDGTFRARFEAKGRLTDFVRAIPTRLIVNSDATLLGAAHAARSSNGPGNNADRCAPLAESTPGSSAASR
jgi:glucokinase